MKTRKTVQGLKLKIRQTEEILTDFIRNEFEKAGFKKGIIGLSGGVDSALVAILSAAALGKENVLGVLMPYRTSSPESEADAVSLAGQIGIRYEKADISPMVDAFLAQAAGGDIGNVRKGNIMARQRMVILYDISAREKGLVIGTSNKTEIMLGYGTQYGDTACALNPVGDLYKTQIWELAAAIGVPEKILKKPPTADLWAGQTDEGELGFSYLEVDRLLYYMYDKRLGENELIKKGFGESFIRNVKKIVSRNQFKSRPPLIARISGISSSKGSARHKTRRG